MQHSRTITRKSASNLALGFVLLPREKRDAMSALYAFCREVDDLADDESLPLEQRRLGLQRWQEDLGRACSGLDPSLPVVRELKPWIERYRLPQLHFNELLQGVNMDLTVHRYPDFPSLDEYCYRVASAVGLLSIEIFGYQDPRTREYAVHLGKALQLTNILRDVRTDALKNRIYLPLDEMRREGVSENEILEFRYTERFARVAKTVADRAREYYRQASSALPKCDRRSMVAAELMGSVYWKLLGKVEARGFDVFSPPPTRLGSWNKGLLVMRTWFRLMSGTMIPNYGSS